MTRQLQPWEYYNPLGPLTGGGHEGQLIRADYDNVTHYVCNTCSLHAGFGDEQHTRAAWAEHATRRPYCAKRTVVQLDLLDLIGATA